MAGCAGCDNDDCVDINGDGTCLRLPEWRYRQWTETHWKIRGHERGLCRWMQATIRDSTLRLGRLPVVYDIGAECGDLSCLWAVYGARIVLIEPAVQQWPNIRRTFELNGVVEQVAACWVGFAGARPVTNDSLVSEWVEGPWPSVSRGPLIPNPGFPIRSDESPTATVDDIAQRIFAWPDIITIDVEGDEEAVLEGALVALDMSRPLVHVAVHTDYRPGIDERIADVFGDWGYVQTDGWVDHETHQVWTPQEAV